MNKRIILYIVLAAIGYGCWLILRPLFSSILWAAIISFATWPIYVFLRKYIGKVCAALVMTVFCAFCMVLPVVILTSAIIDDVPRVVQSIASATSSINFVSPPHWMQHIPIINKYLAKTWEQGAEHLLSISDSLRPYFYDITRASFSMFLQTIGGLIQFVFALFISFFFWLSGDYLGKVLQAFIYKVAGPSSNHLVAMTSKTILGTVYGIIGTALLQGILTGCGLALFDVPESVLLGGIAAFLSLFPIGAPVVWIPAAIWLLMGGHTLSAILLLVYGVVIISGVEHIIRPIFISSGNKLPYLLSVLGIFGGLLAFGGLGIFLGPVLLGLGYTLVIDFSMKNIENTE
ncbi:transporter [Commensalibacter intestini]|uniref:Transporter n=1 Tax=Commensalibacter intestini TaxID=479936 RepID=A0A251ZXK8_9PROT|nr:AI-2E family transporter [Commensalibacter intestini]OUI79399.1 transporter [Commensalibacter intestini]